MAYVIIKDFFMAKNDIQQRLETCLRKEYGIPEAPIRVIMDKACQYFDDQDCIRVFDEFIAVSRGIAQTFCTEPIEREYVDEAVDKAGASHTVLYENDQFRVLWIAVDPGAKAPFHIHYWPALELILEGAHMSVENARGEIVDEQWPIGLYQEKADEIALSPQNSGTTCMITLAFEIKE